MKKVLIRYKDLIVLILGIALFAAGIFGAILLYLSGGFNPANLEVTPSKIQVMPTPLAMQTQEFQSSQISPTTQSTTTATQIPPTVENPFTPINLGKYYVHAAPDTGLETPLIPDRIVIPSVGIDATVVIADFNSTECRWRNFRPVAGPQ